MTVTNTSSRSIRQSRRYCVYQPGKSLLIQITGVLNANSNPSYATSRIGYYDDQNGYFFQYSNAGTLSLVERSQVTGVVTENTVNQANWNINPLLVNSATSYVLDPSKAQIFIFDFQWLGVGRVRCGVVHNGIITYVHEFLHDNVTTQTYTTNMNLPIRYELSTSAIGSGTAILRQICGTAISEGGYNPVGQVYSIARTDKREVTSGSNEFGLLAIRINTSLNPRKRTNVIPGVFDILTGQNTQNLQYTVRLFRAPASDPFASESPTWNNITGSVVQYYFPITNQLPFTNFGNSVIISQGYVSGKTSKTVSDDVTFAFSENNQLTCNIDGTRTDYFLLTGKNLGSSSIETWASLNWREIF
jgi:hypothetical protein